MEWKVDTWQLATAPIRDFSSKAAFRENVKAWILAFGNRRWIASILEASSRVFPVPAPAMMAAWPLRGVKAASCCSLSIGLDDSLTVDATISAIGSVADGAHDGRVENFDMWISPFNIKSRHHSMAARNQTAPGAEILT